MGDESHVIESLDISTGYIELYEYSTANIWPGHADTEVQHAVGKNVNHLVRNANNADT